MRRVFLAATGQNRGKTTSSLGLAAAIVQRGHRFGFLKPVGQRYLVVDGTRADEDALLMKAVFDLPDALDDMSPVTLPPHFTTDFVMGRISEDLGDRVLAADRAVSADKDVVLIEGTGHAGVGAVIGLSNARVAALLDAPVIIVSEGGVGRPIDEIVLNQALFERAGGADPGRHRQQGGHGEPPAPAGGAGARACVSTGSSCSAASRTCSSWPTHRSSWSRPT